MSDSGHQETVAREDDGDPKENDQPAAANLTRAVEVAEELLQAIKQATQPPRVSSLSLNPPPPFHGGLSLPGVPPNYKKNNNKENCSLPRSAHKAKKNFACFPGFPSTPNQP